MLSTNLLIIMKSIFRVNHASKPVVIQNTISKTSAPNIWFYYSSRITLKSQIIILDLGIVSGSHESCCRSKKCVWTVGRCQLSNSRFMHPSKQKSCPKYIKACQGSFTYLVVLFFMNYAREIKTTTFVTIKKIWLIV